MTLDAANVSFEPLSLLTCPALQHEGVLTGSQRLWILAQPGTNNTTKLVLKGRHVTRCCSQRCDRYRKRELVVHSVKKIVFSVTPLAAHNQPPLAATHPKTTR